MPVSVKELGEAAELYKNLPELLVRSQNTMRELALIAKTSTQRAMKAEAEVEALRDLAHELEKELYRAKSLSDGL